MSVIGSNALAGASGQGVGGYEIERSLRFNESDSAELSHTPSSASNRKTWTWSGWVKNCIESGTRMMFAAGGSTWIFFQNNQIYADLNGIRCITESVQRDPSAWYHIVWSVDTTQATAANRQKVYINGVLQSFSSSAFPSQNADTNVNNTTAHYIGSGGASYYLDGYLADIQLVDGQALTPTDFGKYDNNNVWQPKKYSGTYGTNGFHLDFSDNSSNSALGTDSSGNGNDWTANNLSTTVGNGNWISQVNGNNYNVNYDIAKMFDNDPATEHLAQSGTTTWTIPGGLAFNNSFKVHAYDTNGGSMVFNWSGGSYTFNLPTSPAITDLTANLTSPITSVTWSTPDIYGPYVREWIVDGVRLVDNSFADTDSSRDTPTNGDPTNDTGAGGEVSGNYATLNPLYPTDINVSDGNLKAIHPSGSSSRAYLSTIGVTSGRWYWEVQTSSVNYTYLGVAENSHDHTNYIGQAGAPSTGIELWATGYVGHWHGTIGSGGTAINNFYNEGDIIGLALDLDSSPKTLKFYKADGTLGATHTISSTNTLFPAGAIYQPVANEYHLYNFGARPFSRSAPSGYKALCTANLPDPTIEDGSKHFDAITYAGVSNNTTGDLQNITGLNFEPDFMWFKSRNNGWYHWLYDQVRGIHGLSSNEPHAEDNDGSIHSWNSDGVTVKYDSGSTLNYNNASYVAWAWDAASSNTTIAAGSISSQFYDQSQDWSGNGSGSGTYTNQGWDKAFNGLTGAYQHGAFTYHTGSSTFTFDVNNRPTWSNKIEVFIVKYDGTASVNGGSDFTTLVTSTPSAPYTGWVDITSIAGSSGTLSTITTTDVSNNYVSINAIRLDGKMLVDSTVTDITSPSVASTVRANPSNGFSIITMTMPSVTSAKIAHGLNAAPAFYIWKDRDSSAHWYVYHKDITAGEYLMLNRTNGSTPDTAIWNNTDPTSTVINTGGTFTNSGSTVVYAWAEVDGYSKFGSWKGNASADGPFVYTGFKPKVIFWKDVTNTQNWGVIDTERDPDNPVFIRLTPNTADIEWDFTSANYPIDILSNGFKIRNSYGADNANGDTFVFAAWAEHPFKTARAH